MHLSKPVEPYELVRVVARLAGAMWPRTAERRGRRACVRAVASTGLRFRGTPDARPDSRFLSACRDLRGLRALPTACFAAAFFATPSSSGFLARRLLRRRLLGSAFLRHGLLCRAFFAGAFFAALSSAGAFFDRALLRSRLLPEVFFAAAFARQPPYHGGSLPLPARRPRAAQRLLQPLRNLIDVTLGVDARRIPARGRTRSAAWSSLRTP